MLNKAAGNFFFARMGLMVLFVTLMVLLTLFIDKTKGLGRLDQPAQASSLPTGSEFRYGVPFRGTVAEVYVRSSEEGVRVIRVERDKDAPDGPRVLDAVIDSRVEIKKGDRVEVDWLIYHQPSSLGHDILRALEARKIEK